MNQRAIWGMTAAAALSLVPDRNGRITFGGPVPRTPEPEPDHAAHLSRAERRRQMKAAKRLAAMKPNTTKGATEAAPPVSLNSHSR